MKTRPTCKEFNKKADKVFYDNIIQTTLDGFWLVGTNGKLLDVNSTYSIMSGYSKAELLNMSIPDIVDSETAKETANLINHIITNGSGRFESVHRRKDGSTFQVEISTTFLPTENQFVVFIRDISERKQVEEQLYFMKTVVEQISDSAFWSVQSGKFIYVNDAACRSLGYSREELLKMRISDFDPSFPPDAWGNHWEILKKKGTVTVETTHRNKAGKIFPVEVTATLVRYNEEEYNCSFVRDITERKQAEDALRVSEEHYRMLFERANDAIFVYHTSPAGMPSKFIKTNQKATEMLGYSSEELLTFSPNNLVLPERLSEIPGIVEEKKKKGGDCIFEITLLCKDGRCLEVEISDHSFMVGGTPYTLSIVRDITDRKKVEAALKCSKLQLEAVFNNLDAAIYIVDMNSHEILYTNDYMTKVWGKDLTGHICWKSIHTNKTGPCEFCTNDKLIDDDGNSTEPYIWELYNQKVNRWYEVHDQAIPWADGKLVRLAVAIDITERKSQEDLKLEVSLQKEQLRRLKSLKTMAGAIAHRFNNAMMAVQGNLELMTLTLPVGSSEYDMASNAAKAASGASQVGSMMLSYVGQRPLKRQDIPLDMLARESVTAIKTLLHPSIFLRFTPPEKRLYCSMDQQQIQEVIESILTNAIEALDDGVGTIRITFGTDYFTKDSFPVAFQNESIKDGFYTFCQIKDTGHGVEPHDLSRIFEPFFTTRFIGRGLGLALTIGIMQSHHGAITIESVPGQGTTVRILLPSIPPTQQIIPSDDFQGEAVKLSGNILIADDEEMVLDVGRKMLELLGFTVHTAMDGQEAVEKISRNDIDFCAIVLDISMPKIDGIEAMNIIRGFNPTLPILLSSGYSEDDLPFKKGKENKPDGFLSKPFQLFDMRSNLEKLLS